MNKMKKVKTALQKGSVPPREAFPGVPKLIRIDNSYQPNSHFKGIVESLFEDLRKRKPTGRLSRHSRAKKRAPASERTARLQSARARRIRMPLPKLERLLMKWPETHPCAVALDANKDSELNCK
jgi:hypothetical protein